MSVNHMKGVVAVCICMGATYILYNTGTGYLPPPLPVRTTGAPRLFTTDKESTSLFRQFSGLFNRSLPCNTTHPCRPKARTKVILLTYMRSGSTFTGDILSKHPDVFYFFEPLHFLVQETHTVFDYLRKRKFRYHHRNKTRISGYSFKRYLIRRVMSALLNCDFEKMDIDTLSQFHLRNSRTTKSFSDCLQDKPGIFGLLHCLPELYKACLNAKVILTKTIALNMKIAREIMSRDSKVRVIHLVRDPRATIWSEGRYSYYKLKDFWTFVGTFCKNLLDDLQVIDRIKKRVPKRAHVVLYENLAEHPLNISQKLYDVLKLPLTPSVYDHVVNITMRGHEENCSMCISKADSARASQEWRLHLEYDKVKFIDEECQQVYDYLGYKPVESKAVYTNLSIPLHTWPII
ncbi:carbohydrate sulfotransferase 4-like isoform X2 [Haliotis rufescens]|uniref:carbohydrate sulfotransferase 4-like isoform X2 n=1 Tax=Haliotis rufescens TaxID=6454 RepID=UPI00201F00C4|nr:carbohydrate sulfotransferase 4-like isoform X2 [Haliotis rufescens]